VRFSELNQRPIRLILTRGRAPLIPCLFSVFQQILWKLATSATALLHVLFAQHIIFASERILNESSLWRLQFISGDHLEVFVHRWVNNLKFEAAVEYFNCEYVFATFNLDEALSVVLPGTLLFEIEGYYSVWLKGKYIVHFV
jgi:hypothetical protein